MSERKITIEDNGKIVNFIVKRLNPEDQLNFIVKLIGIIAKGSIANSKTIEQVLHNAIFSGKKIEGLEEEQAEQKKKDEAAKTMGDLIREATKGALATLSKEDKDFIFAELLKNVKIDAGTHGSGSYIADATWEELNHRFDSFIGPMKLIKEVAFINFEFLWKKKE